MDDIRQVNVRGTLYNVTSTANINMAPIEDGDTASQAYTINKLMVFKGYLCKTTAAIAQGDTLAVGTNLAYDTIAEEIEGLSDGIGGTTDTFRFGTDGNGEYGYIKKVGGADTFFPFKTKHTETVTPTSRAQVDMGEYHKKRYVTLTSVPNNNTTTYSATARGASIDMGATNTHRYVNTNGVPNSNSSTYSVTTNGTHDMGATNTNRYVSVNVKPTTYQHVYTTSGSGTRGIFGASGTFTETFRPSEDMIVVCDHYYTDGTDFGGYASITGGATWSIPGDSNTKVSYIPANTNATLTVFANGGNTDRTGTFKGRIYRIL